MKIRSQLGMSWTRLVAIIMIPIFLVACGALGAWTWFNNQQIGEAKAMLGDFQDPLPEGFKYTTGLGSWAQDGIPPQFEVLHEPSGMTIRLLRLANSDQSEQKCLQQLKDHMHVDATQLASKGTLNVAGQNMPYFVFGHEGKARFVGFLPSATLLAESKQSDFELPVLRQFTAAVRSLKRD